MRRYLLIALLLLSATAYASSTYRVGSQVLTVGDSAARAMQLMGKPDFKEPVESDFGGYQGERWQYVRDDGRIVIITIIDGRVSDIADRSR
ncbi:MULTISPECIES: DUF2845 domain-containing protein [Dyella]|uniref:DUF2845 domain-containing protein n=1 Tax=Dyella TaxID=231454 RepID=UPI000C845798|nr:MULTISPECIES: DUF2845 domain-containing protein [Dyella]MDR3447214.1 DUF2845 domain-containing protein [Dyella sp.]PMQ06603.1 hypothetical protein DyAD56_03845 [Dyella sp. AD56]ULU26681.1 hypothetical protein DYST_03627 [Dyella terrae]